MEYGEVERLSAEGEDVRPGFKNGFAGSEGGSVKGAVAEFTEYSGPRKLENTGLESTSGGSEHDGYCCADAGALAGFAGTTELRAFAADH